MKRLSEFLFESVKTIELALLADQLKKYKGHDNWDKLIDLQYLFKDIKIDQITPDMVEVVDTTPKTITAARKMIKNKDGFIITINKDNEFDCIMLEDRYCGIPNRENTGENYWLYAKISELAAEMKSSTKMMFIHSAQFAEILSKQSKDDKDDKDILARSEQIKNIIEYFENNIKNNNLKYKHNSAEYGEYESAKDKIDKIYDKLSIIFTKYKRFIAKLKTNAHNLLDDKNFYNIMQLAVDLFGTWRTQYWMYHDTIGNKKCPMWPSWEDGDRAIIEKTPLHQHALTIYGLCEDLSHHISSRLRSHAVQLGHNIINDLDIYLNVLDIMDEDFDIYKI